MATTTTINFSRPRRPASRDIPPPTKRRTLSPVLEQAKAPAPRIASFPFSEFSALFSDCNWTTSQITKPQTYCDLPLPSPPPDRPLPDPLARRNRSSSGASSSGSGKAKCRLSPWPTIRRDSGIGASIIAGSMVKPPSPASKPVALSTSRPISTSNIATGPDVGPRTSPIGAPAMSRPLPVARAQSYPALKKSCSPHSRSHSASTSLSTEASGSKEPPSRQAKSILKATSASQHTANADMSVTRMPTQSAHAVKPSHKTSFPNTISYITAADPAAAEMGGKVTSRRVVTIPVTYV